MLKKEIVIPKFLHDLHGETSTPSDVALTYFGGLISAITLFAIYLQAGPEMAWWKLLLLLLTGADIGAGVVANFTRGTNKYYSGDKKKKQRTGFILLHMIHPAIFLFALKSFSASSVLMVAFVLAFTFVINSLNEPQNQRVLAAILVVSGMCLLLIWPVSHEMWWWFFPLYMIKLFMAFGIRRYR